MSEAFIPPDQMTVKYIQIDLNRKVQKRARKQEVGRNWKGKGEPNRD